MGEKSGYVPSLLFTLFISLALKMSYLFFLLLFVGIPLLLIISLVLIYRRIDARKLKGVILLCFVALIYTTPWDNYLVMQEIWTYSEGSVMGTIGYVPIEEYLFMIMQTALVGLAWCFVKFKNHNFQLQFSFLGVVLALLVGGSGLICLSYEKGTYAGLILTWASLPLLLQWGCGLHILRRTISQWFPLWLGFSVYLSLADTYAVYREIWILPIETRSGLEFGALPVEEALFFAVTNLFVVQGLTLWFNWSRTKNATV
jgi:lycopene cyclase domain-containing protein